MGIRDESYFNIPCEYQLYVEPLHAPATPELLQANMPETLKLLRDIAEQEQRVYLQIHQLPKGDIISEYLSLQSKKVDLVLHQQLAQVEYEGIHCHGTHFGGSHLSFTTKNSAPLHSDQELAINLLIKQYQIAVYCFVKIVDFVSDPVSHHIRAEIIEIGDSEQEQLIRASLQQQQLILKSRKRH